MVEIKGLTESKDIRRKNTGGERFEKEKVKVRCKEKGALLAGEVRSHSCLFHPEGRDKAAPGRSSSS